MKTSCPLTVFPSHGKPAVHAYFDLCPEDPTGQRVVYFQFDGPMPCGGQVMVANRDGSGAKLVGRPTSKAMAHSGARQQWAGPFTAVYNRTFDGMRRCEMVDVRNGEVKQLENTIRMVSPETGMALTSTGETLLSFDEKLKQPHEVLLLDPSGGKFRKLFGIRDCLARHPLREALNDRHCLWFKHTKWAPGGARFFVVFHNEAAHGRGLTQDPRVKSLMICNADGTGLRYLTEFGNHPMWGGDDSYVYYNDSGESGQCLVRCDLDGKRSVILAESPGSHSSLSPDGTRMITDVYLGSNKEDGELHLVDMASGEHKVVARFATPDTRGGTGCHAHPVWSRDGKRIYFSNNETGRTRFYALDLQ